MGDLLKLSIPGKPEYVGTVRLAVSHVANQAGFDIEAVEDIKVAVSEACSNVVCHSEVNQDRPYQVTCLLSEDRLEISVQDQAGGFDMDAFEMPQSGEIQSSGLGIFVIHALMDEVDVSSTVGEGTCVKMTKFRQAIVPAE
jgi:serine/threonine-protein kinase RsbW